MLDPDEEISEEHDADATAIPWHKKALLKYFPQLFLRLEAHKLGVDDKKIEHASKLFGNAERIDIRPLSGANGRGFIVTIDNRFALWFFQDGDHFAYDGFEMGEYENGDIAVFDRLD